MRHCCSRTLRRPRSLPSLTTGLSTTSAGSQRCTQPAIRKRRRQRCAAARLAARPAAELWVVYPVAEGREHSFGGACQAQKYSKSGASALGAVGTSPPHDDEIVLVGPANACRRRRATKAAVETHADRL